MRDPERWYRSAVETIFPIMTGWPAGDDPVALALARMAREITNLLWICLTPSAARCSLPPWKATNPVSGLMLGD